MFTLNRVATGTAVASLSLSLLGSPAMSAAANHPIVSAQRAAAIGSVSQFAAPVPHEIANAHFLGAAPTTQRITFSVVLPLQHRSDLDALIRAQNDKRSPLFRRWLKKGQFAQRFGADPKAVALVESALTAKGAKIERTNATKTLIQASATVGTVEKLFHTTIGAFVGTKHPLFANTTPAVHPAEFHNVETGVVGLDSFPRFKSFTSGIKLSAIRGKAGKQHLRKIGPHWASGAAGGYTAVDLAKAYNYPWTHYGNTAGSGATIGIVMVGDYLDSDISTYYANDADPSHQPSGSLSRVAIDGGGTFDPFESAEVTLDIEQSTSLAPQANELVYEIPDLSDQSIVDAFNAVASDDIADVVNSSFGGCEQGGAFDAALDAAFAQGASQGESFFASSGDQGSSCYPTFATGVSMPSSDPYVTAVGGTTLSTGFQGEYGGEIAWAYSGGGVSGEWALPGYQSEISGSDLSQNTSINTALRNVPDIALNADNVNSPDEIYFDGSEGSGGGTSFASPDATAEYAIIDGFLGRVGLPQWGVYWFASNTGFPFHDVVNGCNNVYDSGYCSVYGFDLVTGYGSFDADALLQDYAGLLKT